MPRKKKTADTTIGPIFQVRDLTAGVNLRPSPTNIEPNQARRLLNTLISNVGELGVYPGWRSFSTSSLGNRRIQGGRRIYLAASTFTLAGDNGNVYKPSDAGVWGSAVLSSLSTTEPFDFPYDRDIVAVFDGTNVPKKSKDGTTWTQLGISAPASAPTLSAVAGGSLITGHTYEVAYAYYDSTLNHVGNISTKVQQAVAGANLTVRAGVTASADAQVTNIKIYCRDVTAGETVLRFQGTYANTTTNRDITTNNWDGQEEAPTDHDVAVAMSFGVVWKNRWWGRDATVRNRLRFTQIFQPQSWVLTFFVDIPFERGEDITGVIPLGDILIVFGYTRFYLIIGQTSLDFEVRPALGSQTGALGFRACDIVENGVVHAGAPGVYLFNGASDELLSYSIDPAWQALVDVSTELSLLPLVYHKVVKELRVGVSYLYPTGNRGEWILDLNRTNVQSGDVSTGPAWFSTDRTVGGYIQWDGNETASGNQGRLFTWSPTVAKLFEERTGTTADGSNISMEYDGYTLSFGLLSTRIIDSYLEYQLSPGILAVDLKVDGRRMGVQEFSLQGEFTRYGSAHYGSDTYTGSGASFARYGSARYGVDRYGGSASDRSTLPIVWPDLAEGRTAQLFLKYVGTGDVKFYSYGHNTFSEPLPRGI